MKEAREVIFCMLLYMIQAITRWSEDQVKRMYMDLTISWTEL